MKSTLILCVLTLIFSSSVLAADTPATPALDPAAATIAPPAPKGPPCPIHTIEGYGGLAMVPTAYLVNPGPKNEIFGMPSVSGTYIYIGHGKNLETAAISETLFGRLELSYGFQRFGIGNARTAIASATGEDIGDDIILHNFNARFLLIEENSFDSQWIPAVTVAAQFKYNQDIDDVDRQLGGAFTSIGLTDEWGCELVLTASKTFPTLAFGRPLIVNVGVRNTNAAWMGFMGFGDHRHTSFEASAIVLATNWLAFCYEYRQKIDEFDEIPGLQTGEDPMHAAGFAIFPSSDISIAVLYGVFGHTLNTNENNALGIQFKWNL